MITKMKIFKKLNDNKNYMQIIDDILDKITKNGYDNLSTDDKDILSDYSSSNDVTINKKLNHINISGVDIYFKFEKTYKYKDDIRVRGIIKIADKLFYGLLDGYEDDDKLEFGGMYFSDQKDIYNNDDTIFNKRDLSLDISDVDYFNQLMYLYGKGKISGKLHNASLDDLSDKNLNQYCDWGCSIFYKYAKIK